MPQRKIKREVSKFELVGAFSPDNFLNWLVTLLLGSYCVLLILNLGGARPEAMLAPAWILGAALIFHGFWLGTGQDPRVRLHRYALLLVPAVLYLLLHWTLLSPAGWRAREAFLLVLQASLVFWLAAHQIRERGQIWSFLGMVVIGAGLSLALGLRQFLTDPRHLPGDPSLNPEYVGQATGSLGSPDAFAALMVPLALALFAVAFTRRLPGALRVLTAYIAVMFLVGVLFSGSVAGLLVLALGMLLLPPAVTARRAWLLRAWPLIALCFAGGVALAYAFSLPLAANLDRILAFGPAERLTLWREALSFFLRSPLTGTGAGSFEPLLLQSDALAQLGSRFSQPRSDLMLALAETGLTGLLVFLIPVALIATAALRFWRALPGLSRHLDGERSDTPRAPFERMMLAALGLCLFAFLVFFMVGGFIRIALFAVLPAALMGVLVQIFSRRRLIISVPHARFWVFSGSGIALGIALPLLLTSASQLRSLRTTGFERMQLFYQNIDEMRGRADYIDETHALFVAATSRDPRSADAWNGRSAAVTLRAFTNAGGFEVLGKDAERAARRAINLYDGYPDFWLNLGLGLWLQNDLAGAEDAFRHATALSGSYGRAWYYLGACLLRQPGRQDEAIEALERSIALLPDEKNVARMRTAALMPGGGAGITRSTGEPPPLPRLLAPLPEGAPVAGSKLPKIASDLRRKRIIEQQMTGMPGLPPAPEGTAAPAP